MSLFRPILLLLLLTLGAPRTWATLTDVTRGMFLTSGQAWQFRYDAANRLTNTVTPLARETRLVFDSVGRVWTAREPSAQMTTNLYDVLNRLTNVTDAVGVRGYRYNGNGSLTNAVEGGKCFGSFSHRTFCRTGVVEFWPDSRARIEFCG